MAIKLKWYDNNAIEEGYRVYRSESPIDPLALPAPLIELPADAREYVDEDVITNITYHYRLGVFRNGSLVVGDEIIVTAQIVSEFIIIGTGTDVHKITPNGEILWTFSGHTGTVNGVAMDVVGNIFTASHDMTAKKITPDGNEIWTFGGHTAGVVAVAERHGFVYTTSHDTTARKLDQNGTELWSTTCVGTSGTMGLGIAHDDFVYVAGGTSDNYTKLSPRGDIMWDVNGNGSYNTYNLALGKDSFICGVTQSGLIQKISPSGQIVWSKSHHSDQARGISVDFDNNVYSSAQDNTVRKMDSNGNLIWTFSGHTNAVWGVKYDGLSNLYTASDDGTVRKLDLDGNEVWSINIEMSVRPCIGVSFPLVSPNVTHTGYHELKVPDNISIY